MARGFNGSTQISGPCAAVNSAYTMACWARTSTLASFGYALTNAANVNQANALSFRGDLGGDPAEFYRSVGTGNSLNSSQTMVVDTWVHLAGRAIATNDADVFVNGVPTHGTTSISMAVNAELAIGAFSNGAGGFSARLTGAVAESCIWNVALEDAEIMSLARGFQPWRIKVRNIAAYLPLVRAVPSAYTDTGSTAFPHPRIMGGLA